MVLAIDIGNSNIVFGIYIGDTWKETWREITDPGKKEEVYRKLMLNHLNKRGYTFDDVGMVVVGSVVPSLTPVFQKILAEEAGLEIFIIDGKSNTGLEIDPAKADEIGSDLIADAVAAYDRTEGACIVVDFGTATTVMGIDAGGRLLGVTISAGLQITADTLVEKAALLNPVPLEWPESVLGRDTAGAMQSGLVVGHLAMVEGLIDRVRAEMGQAEVVVTGGLAGRLASQTDYFDYLEPFLTLNGLRIIGERMKG